MWGEKLFVKAFYFKWSLIPRSPDLEAMGMRAGVDAYKEVYNGYSALPEGNPTPNHQPTSQLEGFLLKRNVVEKNLS